MERSANLIAAERRHRIYELALLDGAVSVSDLAGTLGVVENTIRRDLDILHREGKLIRSYGGATVKERNLLAPPYSQTRGTNTLEKSWIGQAALEYLPSTGSIFINAGSTTYQMVARMPNDICMHIGTNSPEIAIYLASNTSADVDLHGGRIIPESLETDGSMAWDVLENLFWDVSFLGISAIDLEHGITSIDMNVARLEKKIMQNSRKVIALCDSSKFGRFSHVRSGPISSIDVLITDKNVNLAIVEALRASGIEVVIAEEP